MVHGDVLDGEEFSDLDYGVRILEILKLTSRQLNANLFVGPPGTRMSRMAPKRSWKKPSVCL